MQHPALKNGYFVKKILVTHIFDVRNLSLSQLYFDFFNLIEILFRGFVQRWRVTLLFFIIPNLLKTSEIPKPEPNLNIVQIFEAQCPYIRLFESM